MDAVKGPAPASDTWRQWRRASNDRSNDADEDGLGMCLPIGLKQEKKQMLRQPVLPLTQEEIAEIETDRTLDKGYTVWRSLPMESDLDKKLKVKHAINRTSDFTKEAQPEKYLPGFASREGGPISRPHKAPAVARARPSVVRAPAAQVSTTHAPAPAPQKSTEKAELPPPSQQQYTAHAQSQQVPLHIREVSNTKVQPKREASDMSTTSSQGVPNAHMRSSNSGVLRDSVIRH